jgi:hypothetical protein
MPHTNGFTLQELERRVARAEADLADARKEIGGLRDRVRHPLRSSATLLIGILLAVAFGRMESSLGAVQTTKKNPEFSVPFDVTDAKGTSVLRVFQGGVQIRGALHVLKPGGGVYAIISSDATTAGLTILGTTSTPTGLQMTESTPAAFFGTKALKGYLELNDESGTKMVEAGSLKDNKGYVLTTPYRASVSPNGNPSVLMGGAGR